MNGHDKALQMLTHLPRIANPGQERLRVLTRSSIQPIHYPASNPSSIRYPLKKHHPTLLQDDDLTNKSD